MKKARDGKGTREARRMERRGVRDPVYANRLDEERRHYDRVANFDDLPPIFHYWSEQFVRPMLEPLGCARPAELYARYFYESATASGAKHPVFASIGSGDANNELDIARLLRARGLTRFTIECIEMNPALIERASAAASEAGLAEHFSFVRKDFNAWRPRRSYHGVVANQSLHHVTNLEGLFDTIRKVLAPNAYFVTSDIIGRNGHQRWPEAEAIVQYFWHDLPPEYRHHRQLDRYEERFEDWDCSYEGFEGIRSQDILALLLERFVFHAFIGFGNAIDPFVDRGFGPNFDANARWDRSFIDRVHAVDERAILEGYLTPTHMIAVLSAAACAAPYYARGLAPEACVRDPHRSAAQSARWVHVAERTEPLPQRSLPLHGPVRQCGEVRGWHAEDRWAGLSLECAVMAELEICAMELRLTTPPGLPAGSIVSIEANGVLLGEVEAASSVSSTFPLHLARGESATIRIAASSTANLKQAGVSEDVRDLGFHVDAIIFASGEPRTT